MKFNPRTENKQPEKRGHNGFKKLLAKAIKLKLEAVS
jgi:hypothetical protein